MPKVNVSIEARMSSSRLPKKVLMDINGTPAIKLLVDRLKKSKLVDNIIVATTINKNDDILEKWCNKNDIYCFRGSEEDVLNRVVKAHKFFKTDIIVEITGDCPLSDPGIIDESIKIYNDNNFDVVTNTEYFNFPLGIYTQVYSLDTIAKVERDISDPVVREHVSLYFYEHPEKYKIFHMPIRKEWLIDSSARICLDYKEDLIFLNKLCSELEKIYGKYYSLSNICDYIKKHPEIIKINSFRKEKIYR